MARSATKPRKQLGLDRLPCVRIGHLTDDEQRVLRLAVNRLAEKGEWNLDAFKIEFERVDPADAPIEITGFSPSEIDQVILGDASDGLEQGPLEPEPCAIAIAKTRRHVPTRPPSCRLRRRDRPETLRRLLEGDALARLVLTDEPYNVKISGNVTGGAHREFAMASGEMTDAEFLAFNEALDDGGSTLSLRRRRLRHLHRLAGLIRPSFARRPNFGLDPPEPHRLGEDQRRHGQPLPLAA